MNIQQMRTRLGLTQQQLAVKLGVVVATVFRWEAGLNDPSPLAAEKLIAMETEYRRQKQKGPPSRDEGPLPGVNEGRRARPRGD